MTPFFLLAVLCLGMASETPTPDPRFDGQWHQWKTEHKKVYKENEEGQRRAVWEANMKRIELHNEEYNRGEQHYTMEMNAFGDMTHEEYSRQMSNLQVHTKTKFVYQAAMSGAVPKTVDWRLKGYVTPVRFQGVCNACWAFSVTGAIEGQMFRKTGRLIPLSVQNLIDCTRTHGNLGCFGGYSDNAFKYVLENGGLSAEQFYPYEGQDGTCRYHPKRSVAKIRGFVPLPRDEVTLMHAVATVGPISAFIDMGSDSFMFYKEGIYYNRNCTQHLLTHGVLIVGYGFEGQESDNNNYWLIKNSYGKKWGMDGYMKIAKDKRNHCGISTEAMYPIV